MGIFGPLMNIVGHLMMLMIDIVVFFVAIRLICRVRPVGLLSHFNAAGKLLVDGVLDKVRAWWPRFGGTTPASDQQTLVLALALLLVMRLALSAAWSLSG